MPDIPALLSKVDAVLIESVDGAVAPGAGPAVIAAHKPFFIDKPLASTLEDAREIARLAKEAGVPWFSSSSLRFGDIGGGEGRGRHRSHHLGAGAARAASLPGARLVRHPSGGASVHPDGDGLRRTVTRTSTADSDVVVGVWKDGRIGAVRAVRPYSDYGAIVNRGRETVVIHPKAGEATDYRPLVREIVKFFETGKPPVSNEETLEIFAFLDAAQKSKEQGGRAVVPR